MSQIDDRAPASAPSPEPADAGSTPTDRIAPMTLRGRDGRWWARATAIGALALLLSLVALLGTLRFVHRGAALPGTVVAGVDVGGAQPAEVRAQLADLVAARQSDPIVFAHGDDEFTFVPGSETYEADLDAAVRAVMAVGRERNLLTSSWRQLGTLTDRRYPVALPDDAHADPIAGWVADVADEVDRTPSHGSVTADPDALEVVVEPAGPGERVLRDEAVAIALSAIREPGPERADLPVEALPQEVSDDDVERVAELAERAIAEPLHLDADGTAITLDRSEVAALVGSRSVRTDDGRTLELDVRIADARTVLDPYRDVLDADPVEATFEVVSGLTTFDDMSDTTWSPRPAEVEIIPSQDGTRLDPIVAAPALRELLVTGEREGDLPLQLVDPEISTADAEALNVDHLIGTFTTYHASGRPRVHNIQLMADIVRGTVLEPGDTFSVNEHVGRRTAAKGFVADGTIVGGEFVDEIGGGVSQFATTMYNAAFFAGIEIVEHKAHSYYISRYPMGREATLYYPTVDLRIRNDTANGLLIHTSYTPGSITVSLFGDNGDATVTAEHGDPFNHRTAQTIYRENRETLAPGQQRQIQGAGQGFDVEVHRHITVDGQTVTERIFTRYEAQPRIVERNTADPPPPDEEEEEEDDDDEEDGDGGDDDDDGA